ncbi:MAG: PadR family transcriptional regulator [Nitrososphaerota archaeon]|nr:PadR family transcriptional regulator [Nitrososphaerota archaeon]
MPRNLRRKWLRPQAVPRGFFRLYILTLLSRGDETGYSITQKILDMTEGAWRPGPGTMYPMLKGLASDGLAKAAPAAKGSGKAYSITMKGRRELEKMRENLAGAGRREKVVGRLFADLLPPSVYVPAMVNRYREGIDLLRQKILEVPEADRFIQLKELKLVLESQLRWVELQLDEKVVIRGPVLKARHRQ